MAVKLTTPVTRPTISHQAITRIEVLVPHVFDVDSGEMKINRDGVLIRYEVTTYTETGGQLGGVATREVPFPEWPGGFITDMKGVYSKAEQHAVQSGLMGPGTPEDLEPPVEPDPPA